MRRVFVAAVACLCSATAAFSDSENSVLWKEVAGWQVYMDPSMGNACYVTTLYEEGTVLRLGFNFTSPQAMIYLGLGNPKWASLEAGKDYPVEIQFDRNPVWSATATASQIGGVNFINVSTTDTNFAEEFRRKHGLKATFEGKQIAALRLGGSSAAISEMLSCQEAVNSVMSQKPSNTPEQKDPFREEPAVKNAADPFAL